MTRRLDAALPDHGQDFSWNSGNDMQVESIWTGCGDFGRIPYLYGCRLERHRGDPGFLQTHRIYRR